MKRNCDSKSVALKALANNSYFCCCFKVKYRRTLWHPLLLMACQNGNIFFSLPCFIKWTLVWNILCFIHSSFWAITKCALLYYFLFTEETVINTRSEAQARFWKCTIDVLCGPFVFWVTRHHAGDLWVHLIAIIWFIPHWRPYYSWQRLRNSIWYSI